MKSHPESSLPAEVIERTVRPYREENDCVCLRQAECVVDGLVVGIRSYDDQDRLIGEDPLDQAGRGHPRAPHFSQSSATRQTVSAIR